MVVPLPKVLILSFYFVGQKMVSIGVQGTTLGNYVYFLADNFSGNEIIGIMYLPLERDHTKNINF